MRALGFKGVAVEEMLKTIGAFASVFALYKVIVDVVLAKSTKRREEYEFTKKFIDDLKNEKIHSYILEKGFLALTGKSYSVAEIQHLLAYPNPSEMIGHRASSGAFVSFNESSLSYSWKGYFQNDLAQKYGSAWYLGCYIISMLLALIPFYFNGLLEFKNISVAIFSLSLGSIAIMCVFRHEDLKDAKKLILLSNINEKKA